MALAKRVTKADLVRLANDPEKLDKAIQQYFKQDGFQTDSEGKPKLDYRTVTIRHRCDLCSLRWTERRKVATNVDIDPDLIIQHTTCNQCHVQLLHRSKCELALMLIATASKGQYSTKKRKGDPTDVGYSVDYSLIKISS